MRKISYSAHFTHQETHLQKEMVLPKRHANKSTAVDGASCPPLLPSPFPPTVPLFLLSPNSAAFTCYLLDTYGSLGSLVLLQGHSAKPPPPTRSFQVAWLEFLLVSCIPTGPHQWLSHLMMDWALALYLSSVYFSVSKANPVATCAKWTGTMDAALPFLEQHEELASWFLLALCFLRKGLNVHSRLAFSSSSSCLGPRRLGYRCVSLFPVLKSHLKNLSFYYFFCQYNKNLVVAG